MELVYFDCRLRAELCRLILRAEGVQFHDTQVTVEQWMEPNNKYKNGISWIFLFTFHVIIWYICWYIFALSWKISWMQYIFIYNLSLSEWVYVSVCVRLYVCVHAPVFVVFVCM